MGHLESVCGRKGKEEVKAKSKGGDVKENGEGREKEVMDVDETIVQKENIEQKTKEGSEFDREREKIAEGKIWSLVSPARLADCKFLVWKY